MVKLGLKNIENMEFSITNELGRFNRIDPLGITNMRVRGMWTISNPFKVFNYIYNIDTESEFNFMALINNNKYKTLDNRKDLENLIGVIPNLKIEDVEVKEPNNPAQLKKCKLITFKL